MQLMKVDPRSLNENPDDARRSKSSPQSDALLLATVKAVGIIQPPVISPELDGGNGYIIQAGHRRVKQAIAAPSHRSRWHPLFSGASPVLASTETSMLAPGTIPAADRGAVIIAVGVNSDGRQSPRNPWCCGEK
jgi:hypothetical protein